MGDRYQHDPASELVARLSQVEDPKARVRIAEEALRTVAAKAALAGIYHECQGEQPLGTALRWQARVAAGTDNIECPERWWEDEVSRGD